MQHDQLQIASTLIEALPYLRAFHGHTFVVKFGGHAMGSPEHARNFARNIVLLRQVGIKPIVVHGGGPQIKTMLERLDIPSNFIDGLRVTDAATVEVVEMVLAGSINKQIVAGIAQEGGRAVGLSGKDANLITARPVDDASTEPHGAIEKVSRRLGFVGEPSAIDTSVLESLSNAEFIPVIAPVGLGEDGHTYNINADTAAGAIAAALNATKLIMLTDVAGVLDRKGRLIRRIKADEVGELIEDGTISGGMIPKVETCLRAVSDGVQGAYIVDGRIPHSVLLEVFTDTGSGTEIIMDDR